MRLNIRVPKNIKRIVSLCLVLLHGLVFCGQQQRDLNTGWRCMRASELNQGGPQLSTTTFELGAEFIPATVPGTVLTSMLNNKLIPDPLYGMNNELIPDIYKTGREYYTFWFVNDFTEAVPVAGEKVWLNFRGINYSSDIYMNGQKVNYHADSGMYLRQSFDITSYLSKDGKNRIAVIVYPPDSVGNPNGGQGGDGVIGHCVTNQYVAGWDWIQPVRDRNTGIWDKVYIKRTKQVQVENTHVVTKVPGRRQPDGPQKPAVINVSTELENTDSVNEIEGVATYELGGKKMSVKVKIEPLTSEFVEFPPFYLDDPKLWWPNGYGEQPLYDLKVRFLINGKVVSDEERLKVGVRELKAVWNTKTKSRELRVNGQKIFIKGGNRILSDAQLRFSDERYDAEVRYHRDMNLNLIRVWGGGITERPEFYDACDKYGLLVMQDFWVSGDCNGRWYDPLKKEDTNARRAYPDNHALLLESMEDQVRMLRNHPSLAYWCGGNEIRPPADVLVPFRDSILHQLDSTRFFFEFSNDDSMSLKSGDGPYTIQTEKYFWEHRSFPFNSEIGSVGIGDMASLERFIPKEHMVMPVYDNRAHKWVVDSVWQYHKYCGYDSVIEAYGHPKDLTDFVKKAQLVNYNQYRTLMESFSAHMWDWYTGVIIWKTQNPWTAMVGQMYDVYLDPNACLFGLKEGAKPLHVFYDPLKKNVMVANNSGKGSPVLGLECLILDKNGEVLVRKDTFVTVPANRSMVCMKFPVGLDTGVQKEGIFYSFSILDTVRDSGVDCNLLAIADKKGAYPVLDKLPTARISGKAEQVAPGKVHLHLDNLKGALAFFVRVSVVDSRTKKRILPVFCSDNYFTIQPSFDEQVDIEFLPQPGVVPLVEVEGWNFEKFYIEIKNLK